MTPNAAINTLGHASVLKGGMGWAGPAVAEEPDSVSACVLPCCGITFNCPRNKTDPSEHGVPSARVVVMVTNEERQVQTPLNGRNVRLSADMSHCCF